MNDRPTFPPLSIRASAGSGKTYRLTNRMIALLLAGAPVENILATTFTRKAAAEIAERVMIRLASAALDDAEARRLGEQLALPLDAHRAGKLVEQLSRSLDRWQMTTLDAFFLSIATRFELELSLPPRWTIGESASEASDREAIVRDLLAADEVDEQLTILRLLGKGTTGRSIQSRLLEVVQSLHPIYLDAPWPALWPPLATPERPEPEESDRLRRELASFPVPRNRNGAENRTWRKAIDRDLEAIDREDWLTFVVDGLAPRVLSDEEKYARLEIPAPLRDLYRRLLAHARAVLIGRLYDQTRATHWVLARYHQLAAARKQQQGRFSFDEITRILAGLQASRSLESIYYRLDARLHHLLLDEFQDTSRAQWDVLRPIAEETVSHPGERSFFCVGDLKQSIYGWRGATPEIFANLPRDLPGLELEPMDVSYRSAPVVIDAVNQLFRRNALLAALGDDEEAVEEWLADFHPHATARTDERGEVRLEVAPESDDRTLQTVTTLRFAADRVAALHRDEPDRTVGVLVRRNQAVNRLIHELRSRGVLASEEGGNPLTDSPVVSLVLSALRFIDHPDDRVARFHLATSALGERWNLSGPSDSALDRRARRWRQQLVTQGLSRLLADLVRPLKAISGARDQLRLDQLLTLADRHPALGTRRPGEFVRLVEMERVETPSPSPVRVMTIHQSKGLQFSHVVLPELDGQLLGMVPSVLVDRPDPLGAIEGVVRFPNQSLRRLAPELDSYYAQYRKQQLKEQLSLLYVAVTRAEHSLTALVAPRPTPNIPATFAGLLRAAFAADGPAPAGTLLHHVDTRRAPEPTASDELPGLDHELPTSVVGRSPVRPRRVEPPWLRTERRRFFPRRTPSQGDATVQASDLLTFTATEGLEHGRAVHRALEFIEWWEDATEGDRRTEDAVTLGPRLCALLSRADFLERHAKHWSGIDPVELELTVLRERPYAFRHEDELLVGAFDRLVVVTHEGRTLLAEITDYKSDRDLDTAARLEASWLRYLSQLTAYHTAAQRLYRLPPERVHAQLAWIDPDRVRAIGP